VVRASNRLSIIGLTFLALAIVGVVMLITDVLYGPLATALASSGTALLIALLWFVLPLRRRLARA
jgi:hypothetical protein